MDRIIVMDDEVQGVLVKLEQVRVAKGLSHQDVADVAKMHRSDVSKLLRGGLRGLPSLSTMARVARALGYRLKLVLIKWVQ